MSSTVTSPSAAPGPLAESPALRASRLRLAAFMSVAGVMHFVAPRFYERLIPRWLGSPRAWVVGSGVAELVCGALVALPPTRRVGAWASLILLVVVYPGNIKMALDAGAPRDPESIVAWARLPLQLPMWRWAYRHTR
jgi:uncharacterized membrane protein